MNYLQRAWLKVLGPIPNLVNEKLAAKSGILGRIGRFYSFGPRQFGYHASNKLIAYLNHIVVLNMGFTHHKYSAVKSITMNGTTFMRPHRVLMLLGMLSFYYSVIWTVCPADVEQEEGTTLKFIKDRMTHSPINALQRRTSAHYTEINNTYMHEMSIRILQNHKLHAAQRAAQSEEVRKTKYARPGYEYVQAHSKHIEPALN